VDHNLITNHNVPRMTAEISLHANRWWHSLPSDTGETGVILTRKKRNNKWKIQTG